MRIYLPIMAFTEAVVTERSCMAGGSEGSLAQHLEPGLWAQP